MSLPVLIVPILNQPELLTRLVDSIDHPIDRFIVIDNGSVVDEGWAQFVGIHLVRPGHNLGVAASWNLGIKCSPLAPYWLITNHDIEFGPGDLARLESMVEPRSSSVYFLLGMAAFAITPPALQQTGFADESFHPAYDEDLDWHRRMGLAGVKTVEVGFSGTHVGSATIHSDPVLRMLNGPTHMANDRYYAEKWGGQKLDGEEFETPFGKGGHLGDWRLDINRLREQTWRR
jgi:GT2 family glycosyltransferase